jgi:hypothetical protein
VRLWSLLDSRRSATVAEHVARSLAAGTAPPPPLLGVSASASSKDKEKEKPTGSSDAKGRSGSAAEAGRQRRAASCVALTLCFVGAKMVSTTKLWMLSMSLVSFYPC